MALFAFDVPRWLVLTKCDELRVTEMIVGGPVQKSIGRVALLAGVGAFHAAGVTDARFSLGGEATVSSRVVGGVRVDHRTGHPRHDAAQHDRTYERRAGER